MSKVKGIKNPLIMKETLKKIQDVLNDWEEWEIDNGDAYGYVLKLNKNKDVELRIYDEIECESCNYSVAIPNENITSIKNILKGFINSIYDQEINWRNSCLRANKGWYSRKHKSINLWLSREKEDKVLEISKQIAERYSNSKLLENQVSHYKTFVSHLYYALNTLETDWKLEDIRDKVLKRCQELNIQNVGCTFIKDEIIAYKHAENSDIISKATYMVDRQYCNIPTAVNEVVKQLSKEVA